MRPGFKHVDSPQCKPFNIPQGKPVDRPGSKLVDSPQCNPPELGDIPWYNAVDRTQAKPVDSLQANTFDRQQSKLVDRPQSEPVDSLWTEPFRHDSRQLGGFGFLDTQTSSRVNL